MQKQVHYFDANTTTPMSQETITTMVNWCNRGSSSAGYQSARETRAMMETFRKTIIQECQLGDLFEIIFTSGASESNCSIITSTALSYARKTERKPHFIISAIEHKSLMACCKQLESEDLCALTLLPICPTGPNYGTVDLSSLESSIKSNTCMISIMAANGESGIINNISEAAVIARKFRIPFHTDAAQIFGKLPFLPNNIGVDAFSVSFHKLHGPPGVGLLAIKKQLIIGYKLRPFIHGTQNNGLRGGTENIPGIAASFAASKKSMKSSDYVPIRMLILRNLIKNEIASQIPCYSITSYYASNDKISNNTKPSIFWMAPKDENFILPNTLFFAVKRDNFWNHSAQSALEKRGIIIGLGSACCEELRIPLLLRNCVLRISFDENTTGQNVSFLIKNILEVLQSDECLKKKDSTFAI